MVDDPGDAEGLAALALEMLEPDGRSGRRAAARAIAEEHTLERHVAAMERLLADIVEEKLSHGTPAS